MITHQPDRLQDGRWHTYSKDRAPTAHSTAAPQVLGVSRDALSFAWFESLWPAEVLSDAGARQSILSKILVHCGTLISVKSLDGQYLLINDAFAGTLSLPAEQILGKTDFDLFSENEAEVFRRNDLAAQRRGEPAEIDERLTIRNEEFTHRVMKFPLFDSEGTLFATANVASDITYRMLAERDFQALYGRSEAILSSLNEGVICLDREGRLAYANPAAASLLKSEKPLANGGDWHRLYHHSNLKGGRHAQADSPILQSLRDGRRRDVAQDHFWSCEKQPIPVSYSCSPLSYDSQLGGVAVVFRDLTEERRHQAAEQQMQTAAALQRALLPSSAPRIPGFDIAGAAFPAEQACGDYFDFIPMQDGSLCIVVADVSGHGLVPALHMVETRAYLRSMLGTTDCLAEVLRKVNTLLYHDLPSEAFVSMLLMRLDAQSQRIEYCGAGHEGRILRANGTVQRLESAGLLLGVMNDLEIAARHATMKSGDTLLLPTDGIFEAMSPEGEPFGWNRVIERLAACRRLSAQATVETLYHAARGYAGGRPQLDDVTLVVARAT